MEEIYISNQLKNLEQKLKKNLSADSGNILLNIISCYNSCGEYDSARKIYEQYMPLIYIDDKSLKNALLNEYELAEGKVFLRSYPRRLYLMITNVCNLNCIMCQQRMNKQVMYLPDRYREEILGLAPFLQEIIWQGGEVLIYSGFKDMLFKLAKYNNIKHSIVSNFQVDNDELIKLLPTLNIGLTISVDGSTKNLYEKIRKGASFERLVSNIKKFNEVRFKQKKDVPLGMHFVVMKENYQDIVHIVDFACDNKFNHIQYIYVSGDKALEFSNDDKKNIYRLANEAKNKANNYNVHIDINSILDSISKKKEDVKIEANYEKGNKQTSSINKINRLLYCHNPWYKLTFDTDYNYSSDCQCLKRESYIGKSILECWNSTLMQKYRKEIIENSFKKICKVNCFLRNR